MIAKSPKTAHKKLKILICFVIENKYEAIFFFCEQVLGDCQIIWMLDLKFWLVIDKGMYSFKIRIVVLLFENGKFLTYIKEIFYS